MPANHTPFPLSGNNFTTILCLDDIQDPDALLEALELEVVFVEFELPPTPQQCTDTVNDSLSAASEADQYSCTQMSI